MFWLVGLGEQQRVLPAQANLTTLDTRDEILEVHIALQSIAGHARDQDIPGFECAAICLWINVIEYCVAKLQLSVAESAIWMTGP